MLFYLLNCQHMLQNEIRKNFTYKITILLLFFIFFSSIFLISAHPAFAAPDRSDLEAQKKQAKEQLENLNAELDESVEAYNEASWKLYKTKQKIKTLTNDIQETERQIKEIEKRLSARARALYMLRNDSILSIIAGSVSINELFTNVKQITEILTDEAKLDEDYKEKKRKLEQGKKEIDKLLKEQKRIVSALKSKKQEIQKKINQKEEYIQSLDNKIQEAIEQERRASVQRSYSYTAASNGNSSRSSNYSSRGISRDGVGAEAVRVALAQQGDPYVWGADGPNSFDCSGLTMYAYAQVGIYLPHSSRMQYHSGTRVSYSELKPGDLVFFARSGGVISHVGMYVGNGMMVHAPQTGDVVRVVPLSSHGGYAGAVRPY